MSLPKPGIHRHIPFSRYLSWDAARSGLLGLFERSPLHALEEIRHPKDDTQALLMGQAVHTAILEPDEFDSRYVQAPQIDRRTKAGKAAWAALEQAHKNEIILRPREWEPCVAMRDAVWKHPIAAELLRGKGMTEVCAVWEDVEFGVPCKGRLDRLTTFDGYGTIVDLKTTQNAAPGAFSASCARYLYHMQAAFYLDGLETLAPAARRFLHIAVEKERPHGVAVYELDMGALEKGRELYRKHLAAYAAAVESEEWPGYGAEIQPLHLPNWAMRFEEGDDG